MLFVAVCVLWARSYWWLDVAVVRSGDVVQIPNTEPPDSSRMGYSGKTGTLFEADSARGDFVVGRLRFHGRGSVPEAVSEDRAGSYPIDLRGVWGIAREYPPYGVAGDGGFR